MYPTQSQRRAAEGGEAGFPACSLMGVPFDLGGPARGSSLAPRAIRLAGLAERLQALGIRFTDLGDVPVPDRPSPGQPSLRNLEAVTTMAEAAFERARGATFEDGPLITVGGDHSIAIGSVAASAAWCQSQGGELGLIWIDAHGDFNTASTTLSGNIHGMPFAIALGLGEPTLTGLGGICPKVRPEHAVLIGARDLDEDEESLIRNTGIRVVSTDEVRSRGLQAILDEVLPPLVARTSGLHISLDVDAIDPDEVPAVGTPVPQGMTVSDMRKAVEAIARTGRLVALDLVEIDPLRDVAGRSLQVGQDLVVAMLTPARPAA